MGLRPGVLAIVGAVSTSLLVAACGSSGSNPATSAPTTSAPAASSPTTSPVPAKSHPTSNANFNSCSVVTQAEASSAIGEKVSAGVLGNATVEGGRACVFYGPSAPATMDPDLVQPDTVRVVLVKGAKALKWYNDYKFKVPARPVSGYGDKAFFDGGASLSILKGQDYLRIAVAPAGTAPSLPDEMRLAAAILRNL